MPNLSLENVILCISFLSVKAAGLLQVGGHYGVKGRREDSCPTMALSFDRPPRNSRDGFIFGTSNNKCDIILPGSKVSPRHFAINFCPLTGILVVINKSCYGIGIAAHGSPTTILRRPGDSRVIEDGATIKCSEYILSANIPNRGRYLGAYLGRLEKFLKSLPNAQPDQMTLYGKPIRVIKQAGKYLELEDLGEGSFGEVRLVAHYKTGEIYAAKRIRHNIYDDYGTVKDEINALGNLSHEHIVKFFGSFEEHGSICLLTEYLPYGDLSNSMCFRYSTVLDILSQCLEALAYLHRRNIIHRDIKPSNIAVQSASPMRVKLIDFGLATEIEEVESVSGSRPYMAPELSETTVHSEAVDIWSLGASAIQLLNGLPERELEIYCRDPGGENLDRYIHALHRKCEKLPGPISDLLQNMLNEDPEKRWTAQQCLQKIGPAQRAIADRRGGRGKPIHNPRTFHGNPITKAIKKLGKEVVSHLRKMFKPQKALRAS